LLTGEGRQHHGDILREATRLAEAGQIRTRIDPRRFDIASIEAAYESARLGTANGSVIIDIEFDGTERVRSERKLT
jgi:NADPH2:quinone reductase